MRHKVRVHLSGRLEVEMEVEAGEDEDPTDLTSEERSKAISQAFMTGDAEWDVEDVELVDTPAPTE